MKTPLTSFQNLHGSSHLDLSVVKCLPNIRKIPLKELIFWFKYTKNDPHHKYFPRYLPGQLVMFYDLQKF